MRVKYKKKILYSIKNMRLKMILSNTQLNNFIQIPKSLNPVLLIGDVIAGLRRIPNESIDVIITSPPYYQQRKYDVNGEIGQEITIDGYITKLLQVAKELNCKSILIEIKEEYLDIIRKRCGEIDVLRI